MPASERQKGNAFRDIIFLTLPLDVGVTLQRPDTQLYVSSYGQDNIVAWAFPLPARRLEFEPQYPQPYPYLLLNLSINISLPLWMTVFGK